MKIESYEIATSEDCDAAASREFERTVGKLPHNLTVDDLKPLRLAFTAGFLAGVTWLDGESRRAAQEIVTMYAEPEGNA